MEKNIDQAILDAASSVACEVGDLSKEELLKIREQLVGNSKKSDDSFIYGLYKELVKEDGDSHGKRKSF